MSNNLSYIDAIEAIRKQLKVLELALLNLETEVCKNELEILEQTDDEEGILEGGIEFEYNELELDIPETEFELE